MWGIVLSVWGCRLALDSQNLLEAIAELSPHECHLNGLPMDGTCKCGNTLKKILSC